MSIALDYPSPRFDHGPMKAAGVAGVIRYLSRSPGKNLTQAELNALRAAGLAVAVVWETTARMTDGGAAAGTRDGAEANRQADALGFPEDRPIFYAVDHQPSASEWDTIAAYLGAAELQGRRAEVYGNDQVCNEMTRRGVSLHPWQCRAWSGTPIRRAPSAVLFQKVGTTIDLPGGFDENDILAADWGAWGSEQAPQPTHPHPQEDDLMAAVTHPDGHHEMFTVYEGGLVQNWQTAPLSSKWSGWKALDKTRTYLGPVSACVAPLGSEPGAGNVNVFAQTSDGYVALWFDHGTGKWSGPQMVG